MQRELNRIIASVHAARFQAAIHSVEEPGVAAAIEGIADARRLYPGRDLHHYIEHCFVCGPALIQNLVDLGVMVVTQPAFLHFEGDRHLKMVRSEDLNNLYPVGAVLEKNL